MRRVRVLLLVLAACWAVTAVSYMNLSDNLRLAPQGVASLFWAATVTTLAFAAVPRSSVVWRLAGSVATVALVARVLSTMFGLTSTTGTISSDVLWSSISGIPTTVAFLVVFWSWWLTSVLSFQNEAADR